MQLGQRPGSTPSLPPSPDLATALGRAVRQAGDRPAITVLHADRREEQGFRTLMQWVAKGAHLLQLDVLAEPGDAIYLDAPACWSAAGVALAAWWLGCTVTDDPDQAIVAVVHERRPAPAGDLDVLWVGDAIDGGPSDDRSPRWPVEVQSFPDAPPAPRGAPEAVAWLGRDGTTLTHADLIAAASALPGEGTLGVERSDTTVDSWLPAVAARPALTGQATVVLDGIPRDRAAGERVREWLA